MSSSRKTRPGATMGAQPWCDEAATTGPAARHAEIGVARGRRQALRGYCLVALVLVAGAPGFANAGSAKCTNDLLHGRYVLSSSGFTRAPASPPGSPWFPKAILEVMHFNGDGTLTTPAITLANPFGDTGAILQPVGAPGDYTINADCTGTVHFSDPSNVTYAVFVESSGRVIRMIQTNPSNNVFEGTAKRIW